MTEAEWLTSDDPQAMLTTIRVNDALGPRRVSDHKLRLWIEAAGCPQCESFGGFSLQEKALYVAGANCRTMAEKAAFLREIVGNPFRAYAWTEYHDCKPSGHELQFLDSRWRTPTVLALVQTAYEERSRRKCETCRGEGRMLRWSMAPEFAGDPCGQCRGKGTIDDGTLDADRLAILADALEDAGCTDALILRHLRGMEPCYNHDTAGDCTLCDDLLWVRLRGPHTRGCWALDLLLGKE